MAIWEYLTIPDSMLQDASHTLSVLSVVRVVRVAISATNTSTSSEIARTGKRHIRSSIVDRSRTSERVSLHNIYK